MAPSHDDIIKLFDDVSALAIDILFLIKHHGIGALPVILDGIKKITAVIKDGKAALPEVKALDPQGVEQVLQSLYAHVQKIFEAVKAA